MISLPNGKNGKPLNKLRFPKTFVDSPRKKPNSCNEHAQDSPQKRYPVPAKSKAQLRLMAAVSKNPKLAKQKGIPQSVGKEYVSATKSAKNLPQKLGKSKGKK
jgi:hypothetical protein